MKKFLSTCIIAMTSAGIYGFIDMGREIHNGTMIKYEDHAAPKVKAYPRAENQVEAKNTIQVKLAVIEENKKKLQAQDKLKLDESNFKASYFSRGEEIYYEPVTTELTTEIDAPETSVQADTAKTITPPTASLNKSVAADESTVAVAEELELSPRIFSRGSPKMYKKSKALAQHKSKD